MSDSLYKSSFKTTGIPPKSDEVIQEGKASPIEEDIKKSQILYNYYSVITYLGNSAILAATLLATEFSFFFAYLWNRKRTAFDSLVSTTSGEFLKNRIKLETNFQINPYLACHKNSNCNYLIDRGRIPANKKTLFKDLVRDILNTFDMICTGIHHGIIDEDLAYDQLRMIMRAYWEWGKSFILLARMFHSNSDDPDSYAKSNMYSSFEKQIYLWEIKSKNLNAQINFQDWRNDWETSESIRAKVQSIFRLYQITPATQPTTPPT